MKKFTPPFLLLMVIITACTRVEENPITDWVHHAPFPGTPRVSAATLVVGDDVYVCCGRPDAKYSTINEVWKYDSSANEWTQLDTFPGKPRVKPIAVNINGKGYVGLGSNGSFWDRSVFKDFYEYDPTTGKWTPLAPFPGPAANDLAYVVINGCLYTAMGFSGNGTCNDTYKYDPVTDVWTQLEDCPGSYSATAFFSIGNNFYVAGGFQGRNIRTMFRFDTEKGKWFSAASMPEGRMLSNGLAIGGKGYVMLGRYWRGAENGGRLLSDLLEYDPAENAWTRRGEYPGGAIQNAMVFTIRGRGYILMGENDFQHFPDVWSFKP